MIALGSMSLPFAYGAEGARSSLALDAVPVLVLLVPVFAFTMVPDHSRPMPRLAGFVAAGLLAVAVPYSLVTLLDAVVLAGSLGGSVGPGPWLLLAGCLVTAGGVAFGLLPRRAGGRGRLRRPAIGLDESPFDEPLFDSLELDVPVPAASRDAGPADSVTPLDEGESSATLVLEAERAAVRRADDDDDRILGG
jgi:hypothetical protein